MSDEIKEVESYVGWTPFHIWECPNCDNQEEITCSVDLAESRVINCDCGLTYKVTFDKDIGYPC